MGKEIERKFLVTNDEYRHLAESKSHIAQAYLSTRPQSTVRIRVRDDKAFVTIKGVTNNATRSEWEYEIPVPDAREMIDECAEGMVIDKTRYIVGDWEVDEFHGKLEGLVVAEIELPNEDCRITLPSFVGEEVTGNPKYYNSNLASLELS